MRAGNTIAAVCLTAFALTAGAAASQASTIAPPSTLYYPSLTVTLDACQNGGVGGCALDGTDPGLYDSAILAQVNGEAGITWGGTVPSFLDAEYTGDIPLTPHGAGPFDSAPTGIMMMGWLDYLPGDDALNPAEHVVLFVNSDTAASLQGKEWDDLFNQDGDGYTELTILSDLQSLSDQDSDFDLLNFMDDNSNLFADPNGGSLTAVAFSSGVVVGTATASLDAVSATPEPATFLMLGLGLGGIALARWRRRTA